MPPSSSSRWGHEADHEAEGPAGDEPETGARACGETVEGGGDRAALGEADRGGLEGREDGGVGVEVDREDGDAAFGDEVELRGGEGLDHTRLAGFEGAEVALVADEALAALGLDGEGAVALPAGLVEIGLGGEEDGGGEDGQPGEEEEPAGVEAGDGGVACGSEHGGEYRAGVAQEVGFALRPRHKPNNPSDVAMGACTGLDCPIFWDNIELAKGVARINGGSG